MMAFVAASQAQSARPRPVEVTLDGTQQETQRSLRRQECELRDARRRVREQRRAEDRAWQELKQARRQQKETAAAFRPAQRRAQADQWRALRHHRQQTLAQRREVDQAWRQQRLLFHQRWSQLPRVTAWMAILVVTDNCTRQCVGLPLFVAGATVTSEQIVKALPALLPPDLLFLVSDRGTHFTAAPFQRLVDLATFVHVLIARHRPQSNGIAERFIRSLKEWLRDKSWQDDQELMALLHQFRVQYNDQPHQGLPIPSLSPNEFANRIWLY